MSTRNTSENTDESVNDGHTPSDARIILGPLVKYALMGLVLVSVIISTAVLLDSQFNDIDQAARLDSTYSAAETENDASDSQAANLPQHTVLEPSAIDSREAIVSETQVESTAALSPQTTIVEDRRINMPVEAEPAVTAVIQRRETSNPVTTDAAAVVTDTAVKNPATSDIHRRDAYAFEPSFENLIAERNAYLNQMDRIYLEELRARQLRQLQHMRDRLARQEQRIKDWEARFQRRYDVRASDVEEKREIREHVRDDRI